MLRRRRSRRRARLKVATAGLTPPAARETMSRTTTGVSLLTTSTIVLCMCALLPCTGAVAQLDSVIVSSFVLREPETSFFRPRQNGILRCQAAITAGSSVNITWYRNGSRINWSAPDVHEKYELRPTANTGTSQLVLKQFMPAIHAGRYQCLVTIPSFGSILTRPAFVHLAAVEVNNRSYRKENLTSLQGNVALIPCDSPFSVNMPRSQASFELNGASLQLSNKHLITSNGSLLIKSVTSADSGSYRCVLNNREADMIQRSPVEYSFSVEPPIRTSVPSARNLSDNNIRVSAGENVTILCVYSGSPVPKLRWELPYGSRNVSARRVVDPAGFVHITDVSSEDAGKYECNLEMDRVQKSHSFNLVVDGPPGIVLVTSTSSKSISLRCDITGAISSFWTLNGERLNSVNDLSIRVSTTNKRSGDEMRISISSVSDRHQGVYQCFAENQFGMSVRTIRLWLEESDLVRLSTTTSAPQRRRASLIDSVKNNQTRNQGEAVAFSCSAVPNAGVESFRWLFNGSSFDPSDVEQSDGPEISNLIIPRLTSNHSGIITCYVQTRTTFDEATVYLKVLGDEREGATTVADRTTVADVGLQTAMSTKPRRGNRPTQSPVFPLPTQLSANLVGRTVQLTWNIPTVENSVPNLTESFEIQYCRDCRLAKNGQPVASAVWHTVNDSFEPQARRYVVGGLQVGTYVFRINIRYRDGTIRSADFTRPITIGIDAGAGSDANTDSDGPFTSFQVDCVSERNCSSVRARWTYASASRILRENWDGVTIQVTDSNDGSTLSKKMLSGLNATEYRIDVEPNRHLEFSISLVRTGGERSPTRSVTISTYADEDGQLIGYDAILQQTAATPLTYVQVSVKTSEYDDVYNDDTVNATLPINDVSSARPIDMIYVVVAISCAFGTIIAVLLIFLFVRFHRSRRRKNTKYIPSNANAAESQKGGTPNNSVQFGAAGFSKVAYDGLPTSQSCYGPSSNGVPQKSVSAATIQQQNHSGSTSISQHSNVDENGQLLVTSNLTMVTNCDNVPVSVQHPSAAASFISAGTLGPENGNANATIRISMNPLNQRVALPHSLQHQATPYAASSVGYSTKFGTLPIKSAQTHSRANSSNLRMVATPTANPNSIATVSPSFTNAADLSYLTSSGIGAYLVTSGAEYAQPIFAVPLPQTAQNSHSTHERCKTMRPSSRPRDSASLSGTSAASRTDCNCPDCEYAEYCVQRAQPPQLSASRTRIFGPSHATEPFANNNANANANANVNVNVNVPFAFALPPPPPLPNGSPRKIKKPVRKKKSDSITEGSRRTRAFRDDDAQEAERSRLYDVHAESGTNDARGRQRDDSGGQNMSDSTHSTNRTGSEPEMVVLLGRGDKTLTSHLQPQPQPLDGTAVLRQSVI